MKTKNEASVSVCASADISSKPALIQAVECPPLGRVAASKRGVSLHILPFIKAPENAPMRDLEAGSYQLCIHVSAC